LVGTSEQGFFEAVDDAVEEAAKTIKGIKSVEVKNLRAHVRDGRMGEYEATVMLAFEVKREE
jgi:flavin-binding protein dodecin